MKNNNCMCHVPYLRNSIAYDHDFCYTCVKCWYLPVFFSFFFEIFIFGADSAKNGPKLQKILSHSVSQELYLILFWFLVHICKMMIFPSIFVSCFQISDFSGFSELINKCQKEILRCAPTSSHVCDFFFVIKLMVHFRLYLKVN